MLAYALTQLNLVFAHTGCKHNHVDTAKRRCVCTNIFNDAVSVHVESQSRTLVAGGNGSIDVAHVGRDARDAGQTALLVDEFLHSVIVEMLFLLDVEQGSRVDISAAGAHHQAFYRSQTHRSVD